MENNTITDQISNNLSNNDTTTCTDVQELNVTNQDDNDDYKDMPPLIDIDDKVENNEQNNNEQEKIIKDLSEQFNKFEKMVLSKPITGEELLDTMSKVLGVYVSVTDISNTFVNTLCK